jgi:6-phosphofructokinase 1
MIDTSIDTTVLTLGEAKITSPIQTREIDKHHFISDDDKVLIYIKSKIIEEFNKEKVPIPAFELAGPRSRIYFDPSKVRCAIVTCGGLCPGLNDIIRSIVLELYHGYGVRNICGIKYGLQGFIPKYGHDIVDMTPDMVVNILDMGGTILGSSRGPQ